jgi:hypothetical protein
MTLLAVVEERQLLRLLQKHIFSMAGHSQPPQGYLWARHLGISYSPHPRLSLLLRQPEEEQQQP